MRRKLTASSLHLFAGLFAAIFVIALGLSGALLAFRDPIDRALNPRMSYVQPQPQQKSLVELADAVKKHYPGYQVLGIALAERPNFSTTVTIRSESTKNVLGVAVNQYTGEILGDTDHSNNLMDHVREFHSSLMLRGVGEAILWFCAVALVVLSISGLILWSRRKRYGVRAGSPVFTLDLHTATGIYLAFFVLLFGITAIRPVPVGLVMKLPWMRPGFKIEPAPGATPLSADQLLASAVTALPGATPVTIGFPNSHPKNAVGVSMRFPEDHTDMGKSVVFLDPYTGTPLYVLSTRKLNAAAKYAWMWNWEIHTGQIFGLPSQIIAAALSLLLPILAVTGPIIWWQKRKRVNLAVLPVERAQRSRVTA